MNADIVVLATGYDNMRTSARKILGDHVADRCKDVWDIDAEGEINAVSSGTPKICSIRSLTSGLFRCGDQAVILGSGSWVGVWLSAEYTHDSWLCRSRLPWKGCVSANDLNVANSLYTCQCD